MKRSNFFSAVFCALLGAAFLTGGCAPARLRPIDTKPVKPSEPFSAPLPGASLLSPFGKRGGRFHYGLDLRKTRAGGEPILAARSGKVTFAGRLSGYGNMVELKHPDGFVTRYAHMKKIDVKKGATVKRGDVLGRVGKTGRATTPHLHFEILTPGLKFVDPARFL